MGIKSSAYFTFNNIDSRSFGISNVRVSGGLMEEIFMPSRDITETIIRGNDKPYFQGKKSTPLSFNLQFFFDTKFDSKKVRDVARWLTQDYYKPMIFSDNPDRIFYCMPTDSSLLYNKLNQGYIDIQFRCDSPYSYSPVYTKNYPLTSNVVGGTTVTFDNFGDEKLYPEVFITMAEAGDFSIVNLSNGGKEFKFTGLANAETVYIDNETENIESDISNMYRYGAFNNVPLELVCGTNTLKITGKANINIRYQMKLMQG